MLMASYSGHCVYDHSIYTPIWRTSHVCSKERTTNKQSARLRPYRQQSKQASQQADVDKLNSPTSKCTEYNGLTEARAGEVRR